MSLPLLRREAARNWPLLAIIAGVLALYSLVIVTMYDPQLGESLAMMEAAMPQLFAAFGMSGAGATLAEFLANYLYGFLFIAFPLVLAILLANRLLVQALDRGTMAWLLATPAPRQRIAFTLAIAQALALVLELAWGAGVSAAACGMLFPGQLDGGHFLRLNLGLAPLLLLFGAICFCSGCLFSSSRLALGGGAGLCVAFMLLDMLAQVGEKWEWLRWLTPLSLFDPKALAAGDGSLWPAAALLAAALALYAGGIAVFCRRDLSL